jgi:hypothetical protein
MYSALDRLVRYADHPAACADCPDIWPDRLVMYSDSLLYTRTVRMGRLGFAQYVAARVQISIIQF